VIIAGKGSMPAMGDALGPEVREALINYLREKYQDVSVRETIGS
jgi:mono/diheme cytochrome c family protein